MGFWASLGIAVTSGIGAYFASYLREKGKNLATREDIAALTKVVEDIKTENVLLVERFKSHQQLRHAALDKRLEAHQQAFEHWTELRSVIYGPDKGHIPEAAMECFGWWTANCLYLEPEARIAFSDAYKAASALWRRDMEAHAQGAVTSEVKQAMIDEEAIVEKAGDIIMQAVALPGLTKAEADPFPDRSTFN